MKFEPEGLEEFTQIDDYWMKREGLIFYPFDRNRKAYFLAKSGGNENVKEVEMLNNPAVERLEFETGVILAKADIESGSMSKVVLARNQKEVTRVNAAQSFAKACELYPSSFCYLVDLGYEKWVGASPELLLSYKEGQISTVALAGTKSIDEAFTLKEQEEQSMVEDFIELKLREIGLEDFEKSDKQETQFDQLKHLKTNYVAKCSADQALQALKHLQPTSAVCGLPRDHSFAFISEMEAMNRGFYAGITGVLTKESATFYVNLRCARIESEEVEYFAGAGITADSEPKDEWQETQRKIDSIKAFTVSS
ncbi:MAG: chorismate-binding protein [Bacteroidia bacterium]